MEEAFGLEEFNKMEVDGCKIVSSEGVPAGKIMVADLSKVVAVEVVPRDNWGSPRQATGGPLFWYMQNYLRQNPVFSIIIC